MHLTADRRIRLMFSLCLFAPLVSAIGAVIAIVSGLPDAVLKHAPLALNIYLMRALQLAAFGWFVLTLACAFGTALHYARREALRGLVLYLDLIFHTALIFVGQAVACWAIAALACSFLL
jgi:hypothetical protein